MKTKNTRTTTKKAAAMLAAIAITPSVLGFLPISTQSAPLGINSAQAQPRWGTPDWEKNRESRRAGHYRDSDLSRLSSITVRGQVTSNPSNDLFEFRAENGTNYRVLARSNVSLRGISRNDRVQVSGKRDGNILIAYSVTKQGGDFGNMVNLRTRVVNNQSGNRFTIRVNNSTRTVVAERGKPRDLRAGSEVDMTGRWSGTTFYANRVTVRGGGGGGWQDGQSRQIRGTVTTTPDNNRFSLRIDNRETITVSPRGFSVRDISRGDEVEVTGRWNRQSNVFDASSVRKLRGRR